jgi:hypothetical protein
MRHSARRLATIIVAVTCFGAAATVADAPLAAASPAQAQNSDGGAFGGYLAYNATFTAVTANGTQPSASCTSTSDLYINHGGVRPEFQRRQAGHHKRIEWW